MIRVGIVGLGFMGRMHYRCWKALEGVKVAAICEDNPKVLESADQAKAGNIENARRRLATLKPQVEERAAQASRAATGFARRNPWSAMAIGALIVASVAAVLYASMSED